MFTLAIQNRCREKKLVFKLLFRLRFCRNHFHGTLHIEIDKRMSDDDLMHRGK